MAQINQLPLGKCKETQIKGKFCLTLLVNSSFQGWSMKTWNEDNN